jgi:hypothetical protein
MTKAERKIFGLLREALREQLQKECQTYREFGGSGCASCAEETKAGECGAHVALALADQDCFKED